MSAWLIRQVTRRWLAGALLALAGAAAASERDAAEVFDFTNRVCRDPDNGMAVMERLAVGGIEQRELEFRGAGLGTRYRIELETAAWLELDVLRRNERPSRFVASRFNRFGDPLVLVSLDGQCRLQVARQIHYTRHGQATEIVSLDESLEPFGEPDWINPPLEFIPRAGKSSTQRPGQAAPLRVALVDSGVNYRLPEINRRLARDRDGELVGFDYWDMDALPFDAHPVDSGFFLQRHGTRTASIVLREAPEVELVPYRYPRPDMSRMRALVEHAAGHGVAVVGMPLGSNRAEDWTDFADAARAQPQMLFIASAGNDGRDIDRVPVYPAALGLDNLLVVTSADDFVRPAERTNWGQRSVDYLLPAENVPALDFSGSETRVSGSSYAVARAVALAARISRSHPGWSGADLIAEFRRRYGETAPAARRWVAGGYIPDPLAGAPVHKVALPSMRLEPPPAPADLRLDLDLLVLDPGWPYARIRQIVQRAFSILSQCGIAAGDLSVAAVGGEEYLRDLSTGSAHTLMQAADVETLAVAFARDTRMQAQFTGEAFGLANTRSRPWLANSVWLMLDVDDPGVALAHELWHVLANSGEHVEMPGNLMQGFTTPSGVALTPAQCRRARVTGSANRLLFEQGADRRGSSDPRGESLAGGNRRTPG